MLPQSRLLLAGPIIILVVGVALLVWSLWSSPSNEVRLVFSAEAEGEKLVYDEFIYTNPGGTEKFKVRDFRFYLSNIELHGKDGSHKVPDSYHLVRFDNKSHTHSIVLQDVPLISLTKVTFSIGVDDTANTSIESKGDLDPNSRMAWNWEVGYKFVLVEGGIKVGEEVRPLVYHIGFGENRRALSFEAPTKQSLNNEPVFHFSVDLLEMFSGDTDLNMAELNTVKFDRADAALIANNYQNMISIDWSDQ